MFSHLLSVILGNFWQKIWIANEWRDRHMDIQMDGHMDGQMDTPSYRNARSHQKYAPLVHTVICLLNTCLCMGVVPVCQWRFPCCIWTNTIVLSTWIRVAWTWIERGWTLRAFHNRLLPESLSRPWLSGLLPAALAPSASDSGDPSWLGWRWSCRRGPSSSQRPERPKARPQKKRPWKGPKGGSSKKKAFFSLSFESLINYLP